MTRFLVLLLRLFPPGFRRRFGAEVADQIRRDHARVSEKGVLARWGFALATGVDLIRSALAERMDPTWEDTEEEEGWEMGGWVEGVVRDLGHAVRSLRRSPGFTAVSVATLGVAIGANVGIFNVVDAVLLRPLPFPEADRLVYLGATAPGSDMPDEFRLGTEFTFAFAEQSELLEGVGTYNTFTNTLHVGDRVERVLMSFPSLSVLEFLDVAPLLGRLPVAEDDGGTVVISHRLWTTWFNGDPGVLGQSVYVGGGTRTVVGVMPPDFWFPNDQVLLWGATNPRRADITPGRFNVLQVARVKPGVDAEALAAELTRIARRVPQEVAGSPAYATLVGQLRTVVRPLEDQIVGPVSKALWVLLGSVAVVLVIACANVANLFLVRGERRQRDLAVRRALGAGRAQLLRAQLAEAVVISLAAGGLAILIATAGTPLLLRMAPPVPRMGEIGLSTSTLMFTLVACVFCVVVCGVVPALRAAAPRLSALRDGGRGASSRRTWVRDGLVAGQTALALVLLIGSGLLMRSFQALRNVDPGYDTRDVLTFQIAPEEEGMEDGPSYARFHLAFMERLQALPGVESVGVVENVPLNEGTASGRFLPEAEGGDLEDAALLNVTFTGGDYFRTMGIPLIRGRLFTDEDQLSGNGNILLSESAARLLWGDDDPVGRRLRFLSADLLFTVVGVVGDVLQDDFRGSPQPLVYNPLAGPPRTWTISSPAYVIKARHPEMQVPVIRELVREIAPSAPMYRVYTMEGLAADSMQQLSFTTLTLGLASVLAMLLGALGLYGVLSYTVAARAKEIGVRMALGARAGQVQRLVVGQGTRVVAVGIVVGLVGALAVTRVLGTLLFDVGPVDPIIFTGMSAGMIGVGALASWLPARRASGVDPVRSLGGDG